MGERGFTLVEIMVASAALLLTLASIYALYLTGLAYFRSGCKEVQLQSKARLAGDRLVIGRQITGAAAGITDGIRFGKSAEIFDDIGDATPNPLPAEGDYIKVQFPPAADTGPQGYYFSGGRILATMGTDGTGDDVAIVDEVVKVPGADVFSMDGATGLISINFTVRDDSPEDGYQGIDISTGFYQRN